MLRKARVGCRREEHAFNEIGRKDDLGMPMIEWLEESEAGVRKFSAVSKKR